MLPCKLIRFCRKERPSKNIRLSITLVVQHNICDALDHSVSDIYKKYYFNQCFIRFFRIGEKTYTRRLNMYCQNINSMIVKVLLLQSIYTFFKKYCPVGPLEHKRKIKEMDDEPIFPYPFPPNIADTWQE